MLKGSVLLGKPVIICNTGERYSTVQELIIDHGTLQLRGFLLVEGDSREGTYVLPMDKAAAIGRDAITVPNATDIMPMPQMSALIEHIEQEPAIKDARLVTSDDRFLGNLTDLYFDETGALAGHEISGGIFADALSGRSFVPTRYVLQVEHQEIIVAPEVVALVEQQAGWLKAALQSTKEKLQKINPAGGPAEGGIEN